MMKCNQIIKSDISSGIISDFIIQNCRKEGDEYISDKAVFKKMYQNGALEEFMKLLKPYYFDSKKFYVERSLNYKNYNTILRQVTKNANISSRKRICYFHNSYEIIYYFSLKQNTSQE
jgi:tRNA G18 (ribose-2'-O)-methylase SpoU